MSESACLRRSLSQPSGSYREEGDPLRCLTESVSFGRFAIEPLDWSRWSTFSHNRYIEEAERYSKPGSVAEKKAYFEAHFKRKAAERAAALLEASKAAEQSVREDKNSEENSIVSKSKEEEEEAIQETSDGNNSAEKTKTDDLTTEENMLLVSESHGTMEECSAPEIIPSVSQETSTVSFNESSASKVLLASSKKANRAASRSENSLASSCKNFIKGLANRKSEKSLNMSIQFSSRAGATIKASLPFASQTRSSKRFTPSLNVSKNGSDSLQAKAKASENGTSKKPLPNLKPEYGSARSLLFKPVTRVTIEPSTENSNSMNVKASKPRSSIASSPFNFRSEERAARRKEFYEKLEERRIAEEAVKKHPQTRYQPKSTKFAKKPSSTKITDTTSSRSSASTKAMCIENDRTGNQQVTSRSQKNARENSSPNIQNSA